jgi:hypothetical protein
VFTEETSANATLCAQTAVPNIDISVVIVIDLKTEYCCPYYIEHKLGLSAKGTLFIDTVTHIIIGIAYLHCNYYGFCYFMTHYQYHNSSYVYIIKYIFLLFGTSVA